MIEAQAFSEGGVYKKGKGIYLKIGWLTLLRQKTVFFSQDYIIRQNQVSYSFKYNLYRKMFFKLL